MFVPQHEDDFPSLGWQLLDWFAEYLPSPRDPSEPLIFVDDQAMSLVEFYRLHPVTGQRVYRRGYSRRSKGKGKSPWAAAWVIGEFAGPVRFAGWDAAGQPVGRPWGTMGDPRPWVQCGAVSEGQTDNTWSVVHYFLTENDGKASDALGIDPGLTRCLMPDKPGAKLEPVTTSAGTREGQPLTAALLDESHLLYESNGGVKMAEVLRDNVSKLGGTSFETTNSFIIGAKSVAEGSYNAVRKGALGIYADEVEAPHEIDGIPVDLKAPDDVLEKALRIAYGDSWWIDIPRLVADVRDPTRTWTRSARMFFNWNQAEGEGWTTIPQAEWLDRRGVPAELVGKGFACLQVGADQRHAALGFAGREVDGAIRIEVVKHEAGTAWVVEACKNAQADTGQPIIVDPKSPTAGVLDDLKAAGVRTRELTPAETVTACAAFQRESIEGGLKHLGAQNLTDAVRLADVRRVGEAWVFSERATATDISPLLCVVYAAFAVRQGKPAWFMY